MDQYTRFGNMSLSDRAYGALDRVNSTVSRGVNYVLDSLGLSDRADRMSSAIQIRLFSDPPGTLGYATNNSGSLIRNSDRDQASLYDGVCFKNRSKKRKDKKEDKPKRTGKRAKRLAARARDERDKGHKNKESGWGPGGPTGRGALFLDL